MIICPISLRGRNLDIINNIIIILITPIIIYVLSGIGIGVGVDKIVDIVYNYLKHILI